MTAGLPPPPFSLSPRHLSALPPTGFFTYETLANFRRTFVTDMNEGLRKCTAESADSEAILSLHLTKEMKDLVFGQMSVVAHEIQVGRIVCEESRPGDSLTMGPR